MPAACIAVSILLAGVSGASDRPAALDMGIAVTDITPPVGWRLSGYFEERFSTGTRDPLQARAVVFGQGDTRVAFVFCDLIGMPAHVSRPARALASDKTGIPIEHIVISATHTHTGPLFFGALHKHFHERAIERDGKDVHEPIDYVSLLVSRIAEAIASANARLRPISLRAGTTRQSPTISFNRRHRMKDGSIQFRPRPKDPDIVGATGPIDPDITILLASEPHSARSIASLTVFALHPDTTGGTLYSADYPHHLEQTMRTHFGPDFVSLYGLGACGDVNHIDITREQPRSSPEIGELLAESIRGAIGKLRPLEHPGLAIERTRVRAALQQYTPEQIARAAANLTPKGPGNRPSLDHVEAFKITDLQLRGGHDVDLEVQAIRLDADTAIVTLPSELFAELGLAIKRGSPFRTTFVIELANDTLAYIPAERAFADGGYEVVNSRVVPGTGERLVDAAVRLLEALASPECKTSAPSQ